MATREDGRFSEGEARIPGIVCRWTMHQGDRDTQEDRVRAVVLGGDGWLLVTVADGVGGAAHGEVASEAIVTGLIKDEPQDEIGLQRAIVGINQQIVNQNTIAKLGDSGMCSTVTSAVFVPNKFGVQMCWLSIGDSRAYVIPPGQDIRQVTTDDTFMFQGRSYINNVVGHPDSFWIHPHSTGREILLPGYKALLCTDGLYKYLEAELMRKLLSEGSLEEMARNLLLAALGMGDGHPHDNIGFALVQVTAG